MRAKQVEEVQQSEPSTPAHHKTGDETIGGGNSSDGGIY